MHGTLFDMIIVGGGVMGSSTAYHLMKNNRLSVAVIERDPTYARASTPLSIGNLRTQFNLKENVQISQYAFEFLDNFEEEMAVDGLRPRIAWHREGNLFVQDEKRRENARKEMAMQQDLGCDVEWWSKERLQERLPHCNWQPYIGATYGPNDGTLDPHAVLMGFKAKARSLGAVYITDEVVEVCRRGGRVTGVKMASGATLKSDVVLNCAGAWAGEIARTAGVDIPVVAVKRQVFAVDPQIKQEALPRLTVLPSGLYIAREAGGVLFISKTMHADPVGFNFSWDEERFMEVIWPEAAAFNPQLETLKLIRGWAGLYAENTLDANAILGEWPGLDGFFLANGFSGHGFQQAAAVGRHMSELMTGKQPSMDLSIFGPERILENKPIRSNVVV